MTDAMALLPSLMEVARFIDVLSVVRRSKEAHRALVSLAREDKIFYVYDTQTDLHTKDIEEHRFLFTNRVKRSRYFVVYPAKWDRPDERGDQSETGSRYFEGAEAGTIMIRAPPLKPELGEEFPWADA